MTTTTVRTRAAHGTDALDLGAHAPKPTALTAGQTEASATVWDDARITTGLWECTPGDFTAERVGYTEICTILSGRVTVEVAGEEPEEFGPGDVMVMPSGWVGVWRVHEPLRKHFTTIAD
ncbi:MULTISPECIES: cupin domain-containing protein [Bacteria]|uniref:Cupin n=2 Tax=Bacteria TaxID=2 RepID=A0A147GKQ5_9BURK|nr:MULTISPECIES: cupin domain-containing protein [Bacteria]KTR85922.1 cupin [Leucobacter chromiiresistens]KTT05835.1 cupin [Pseudacidovorax intermedius]